MEKLTKRLEKFVSIAQNHIFADGFRSTVNALNEKAADHAEMAIKSIVTTYRRTRKYVYGKDRTKRFLMSNISVFEREHNVIVDMIEHGNVKDNWATYLNCKNRISAILKANRRLNSSKFADSENVKSYLSEYITRRRLEKKYQLT